MASQEAHSEGLTIRDEATVVPSESPPFRAGMFKLPSLLSAWSAWSALSVSVDRGTPSASNVSDPFNGFRT
jgi:hypothetical protein